MNNSNYKNKYLKYKNKYLQQTELKGGSAVNENPLPSFKFKIPNTKSIKSTNRIMRTANKRGDIFIDLLVNNINNLINIFIGLILSSKSDWLTPEFTHLYLCTIINLILIAITFVNESKDSFNKPLNKLCDTQNIIKCTFNSDKYTINTAPDKYIIPTNNIITNNINTIAKIMITKIHIHNINLTFLQFAITLQQIAKIEDFQKIFEGQVDLSSLYFSYKEVTNIFNICSTCIDDNSHMTIEALFEYLISFNTITDDSKCLLIKRPSIKELTEFNFKTPTNIGQMSTELANFIIDHIINMVGLLTYLISNVNNEILLSEFIFIYMCTIINLLFIIQYFAIDTYYELPKNIDLKSSILILYLVAKNHNNFNFKNATDSQHVIKEKITNNKPNIFDTINTIFSITVNDIQLTDTEFYVQYKNKLKEIVVISDDNKDNNQNNSQDNNQNNSQDNNQNNNQNENLTKIMMVSKNYSEYIKDNTNKSIIFLFEFLNNFIKNIGPKPIPVQPKPVPVQPQVVPPQQKSMFSSWFGSKNKK
jgi:hypothetical protein